MITKIKKIIRKKNISKTKKAMELSINFVVMLILAIAVFSLGLVFITNLFSKAEDIKFRLDSQSESELKSIINGGKQIAIFPSRFTVKKGTYKIIGVGILNSLKTPGDTDNFQTTAYFVKAIDNENDIICDSDNENSCFKNSGDVDTWLMTETQKNKETGVKTITTIPKNTQQEILIAANIPKDVKSGTYIFGVDVSYDKDPDENSQIWKKYGSTERFYLIIN